MGSYSGPSPSPSVGVAPDRWQATIWRQIQKGNILLISTGYYSDRLKELLPKGCNVTVCDYIDLSAIKGRYDWVLCAYTETSTAFKANLKLISAKAKELGAYLYVDATGSIGLEEDHELADVMAFSSCKGLFGLTGACFIAHKEGLQAQAQDQPGMRF